MNKHFEDAVYYLKRAGETAGKGVSEELEPLQQRFRDLAGEEGPDSGRLEELQADLRDLQERAEGEAREAIADARDRLEAFREQRQPAE